jgi:hypothetical protein
MEWTSILPKKVKAVFKDISRAKLCSRIVALGVLKTTI